MSVSSATQVQIADFYGNIDRLAAARLTAARGEHVDAPLIKGFALNLECTLIHT